MKNGNNEFERLVKLSKYLRSPDGCPWDREQTLDTLRSFIIEEAYELVQAIDSGERDELIEELGDHLYQVVFASQIAEEDQSFNIYDVLESLCDKLVRRHPHVFGDEKADNAREAVRKWHSQKLKEKSRKRRLLEIPAAMPSVLRAQRVGEKVSQVGFDWDNTEDVVKKLREELSELEREIGKSDSAGAEKEWGDLFFALVNLGRHLGLDTESTAHSSINKFIERFGRVEEKAEKLGKNLADLDINEMETMWQQVKSEEDRIEKK